MIRRGFLAGLGALVGAGKAVTAQKADAIVGANAARSVAWHVGEVMPEGHAPGVSCAVGEHPGWKKFNDLMQPTYRRRRRERAVVELLGGMPPHIASCHSWAPWFRAQRAVAWAQQQHDAEDTIEQRLKRAILGGE